MTSANAVPGTDPAAPDTRAKAGTQIVYLGTYTSGTSKGIALYQLDMATGKLTPAGFSPPIADPSFLVIHPNHRFLYAVSEISNYEGKKAGGVAAFAIDPKTGSLTFLNEMSSVGDGPCHVSVDKAGKHVLVANYGGGSVAVLPILPDGRLGEHTAFVQHQGSSVNKERQNEPHAHSLNLDAANHFAFAADLGLDKVLIYRYDAAKGTLTPNAPPFAAVAPGAGPRHFAFHPGGHFAYVINEINSTVTAFTYDAKAGNLAEIQTVSTLPAGYTETSSTAEVQVSPNGKFLYGSNRGHNSIVVYAIDQKTGKLTFVEHQPTQGKTPRNFGIDPTGTYLIAANQDSNTVVVFRMDAQTGRLTPTGQVLTLSKPVCVKFLPLGH